ncbi:MAG: DUF2155 domain-containing protein [Acidiphilium sp.]|nr:DUF2155 domain-containing protein [Acidiphilium sp.]MDD4936494.1 DUF2155 domain-containing protein [Acidiphilium sp.]
MIGRAALWLGASLGLACGVAWGQSNGQADLAPVPLPPSITKVPDAPLPAQPDAAQALPAPDLPAPTVAPPPGLERPSPQGGQAGALPPMTADGTTQTGTSSAPAQVKPIWDRRATAVLDVLDKEDGAVRRIQVPVGSTVSQGKLEIKVGACVVRPQDMPPDAAIFVTVRPETATPASSSSVSSPLFRGWLIRSEPGATVVGDAAMTFRLIGCTGG